jgi:predicted dehydrogenase
VKKLRVGLIGLGLVSEAHLTAYRDVESVEVVAGADTQGERLRHMAARWGLKAYSSYEEMLAREQLDIACVLTPPCTHRAITEHVAARGVHVLCEKPMAVTLEDARAMIASCDAHGVRLCYGSSYRYLPACRRAKELIDEGLLGEVSLLMETHIGGEGGGGYRDLGPHHYPLGGPGGSGMGLVDHGVHLVDIFRWLTGSEVRLAVGRGNCSGEPPRSEFLTMLFESGALGQLVYDEATYPSDMPGEGIFSWGGRWHNGALQLGGGWDCHPGSIRVHGPSGALRIFPYPNRLFLFDREQSREIELPNRPMPANFALQMASFVERLQRDEPPEVTGQDGLKALRVILAAYESAQTGRVVQVK